MSDSLIETAKFIQHHLPGLDDGEYAISIQHKFEADVHPGHPELDKIPGGVDLTTPLLYKFGVQGPRFTIDPTIIQAKFPPDGSFGEFSNVLPHIVLEVETLPWSRKPLIPDGKTDVDTGSFPDNSGNNHDLDIPTWLAVLILTEDDYTGTGIDFKIENTNTGALFGSSTGDFISPALGEDITNQPPWINATDPCQAIKIPIALFSKIVPSLADLFMMANVRQVKMGAKPAQPGADIGDLGTYSIVVGNRVPVAGKNNYALLVSLENMQQFLPDHDGNAATIPANFKFALLPVLASWKFISSGDSYRFDHLLESLNGRAANAAPVVPGPLPNARLKMYPPDGSTPTPGAAADAVDLGYIPVKHTTRNNVTTASWYRGPLIPYALSPTANEAIQIFRTTGGGITPAIYDADALVRLDPSTGLFDVSYASAWQLGRLLALQDKNFSISLYQWKRQMNTKTVLQLEQDLLASKFAPILDSIDGVEGTGAGNTSKSLLESTMMHLIKRTNSRNL